MNEDLERIGRKLAPQVLRGLADHLERITAACRSQVLLHHGPGGNVRAAKMSILVGLLDTDPPKGAGSVEPTEPTGSS